MLTSCTASNAQKENVPIDKWGITMSAKDVTSVGATVVFEQKGGDYKGILETGAFFSLEVLKEGEWIALETNPLIDYAWEAIAYTIKENGETKLETNWEWLYGKLEKGTYRIGKQVTDFVEVGNREVKFYNAQFVIE